MLLQVAEAATALIAASLQCTQATEEALAEESHNGIRSKTRRLIARLCETLGWKRSLSSAGVILAPTIIAFAALNGASASNDKKQIQQLKETIIATSSIRAMLADISADESRLEQSYRDIAQEAERLRESAAKAERVKDLINELGQTVDSWRVDTTNKEGRVESYNAPGARDHRKATALVSRIRENFNSIVNREYSHIPKHRPAIAEKDWISFDFRITARGQKLSQSVTSILGDLFTRYEYPPNKLTAVKIYRDPGPDVQALTTLSNFVRDWINSTEKEALPIIHALDMIQGIASGHTKCISIYIEERLYYLEKEREDKHSARLTELRDKRDDLLDDLKQLVHTESLPTEAGEQ